jgi:hypothetical protein
MSIDSISNQITSLDRDMAALERDIQCIATDINRKLKGASASSFSPSHSGTGPNSWPKNSSGRLSGFL